MWVMSMKYLWRISLAVIVLVGNLFSYDVSQDMTFSYILGLFFNSFIAWIIGSYLDKYIHSKKELGSIKTDLIDYSHAMDSVADGIAITNIKGEIIYANDAHSTLYGYSKDESLKKSWKDFYSSDTLSEFKQTAYLSTFKNGQWRGEVLGTRKDGSQFPQEIVISHIKDTNNFVSVVRDITKQKQYIHSMKHIAENNDLTNLPNRRKLFMDLENLTQSTHDISMLFMDLDRFKIINDTMGHDIGDMLLINIANRLRNIKNDFTNIYHVGGDEFIVLIKDQSIEYVKDLASAILSTIKKTFYIDAYEINISASIGIGRYPDDTLNIYELIKFADTAMYYVKMGEKDAYMFFNNELKARLERKALIEAELRKAIKKNDEFTVHFQPKVNLIDSSLSGMEALIRWNNELLGNISPMEFIPIAEELGLINDIGRWMVESVLKQMQIWQQLGYPLVKISVNVSKRQLRGSDIVEFISATLKKYEIDAKYFEVEITESVLEDLSLMIPKLTELKKIGVGIAIDDFGTGYSSLNLLKNLPIDTLKIDQSFVLDVIGNSRDQELLKTMIEFGRILDLHVVAEGIETEEHYKQLIKVNCPIGQGYYFSKPKLATEIEMLYFTKQLVNTF